MVNAAQWMLFGGYVDVLGTCAPWYSYADQCFLSLMALFDMPCPSSGLVAPASSGLALVLLLPLPLVQVEPGKPGRKFQKETRL